MEQKKKRRGAVMSQERRADREAGLAREDSAADGLIEGRNAVTEALRAGTAIDKIYIARGDTDRTLSQIVALAKSAGIVVADADHRKLDAMSCTHSHQGVIAVEGSPQEVFSSGNARMKEFLGKFHQG